MLAHAVGVLQKDLGDQRRAGGSVILGCLGVRGGLWRFLEVLWVSLESPWRSLGRPWSPWEHPGSVLGWFRNLRRSLGQSWEIKVVIFHRF